MLISGDSLLKISDPENYVFRKSAPRLGEVLILEGLGRFGHPKNVTKMAGYEQEGQAEEGSAEEAKSPRDLPNHYFR